MLHRVTQVMCPAVMAAVMFLDEDFYFTNAVGLGVLILGVFWFNYTKYKKVAAGEIKPAKSGLEPYKEDAHDVVRLTQIHTCKIGHSNIM